MAELVTLADGRIGWLRKDGIFREKKDPKAYEKKNLEAVKHGGYSDTLISTDAETVLKDLIEVHGALWLMELDGVVVNILCRAKVRHDRFDKRIDDYPDVADIPRTILEQVSREARTIVDCCSKLGLTATDRAALMKDTGWAARWPAETADRNSAKKVDVFANNEAGHEVYPPAKAT